MDVKHAVKTAKDYVSQVMSDEGIINVGLEEVRYDDEADKWYVTIGFSRPWDRTSAWGIVGPPTERLDRSYKVVSIRDADGQILSLKDRILEAPSTL